MALNSEFFVKLGLQKEGFDKGLKEAGGEVDDLGKKLGGLEKDTGSATKGLDTVGKSAKAAATSTKSFTVSLKAIKGALISTGIGVLVVLLGEVVANWREILDFIDGSEKKLRELNTQLETGRSILSLQLKENKLLEQSLINQGKSTDALLKKRDKILQQDQQLALAQLQLAQAGQKRALEEAKTATALERLSKDFTLKGGGKAEGGTFVSPITAEEREEIDKFNTSIFEARISLAALGNARQVLTDGPTKDPEGPLKALTGIDTSVLDGEISDIQFSIAKLKNVLKDSSSFAETEATQKQIFDAEIKLIELQLAKKLRLAGEDKIAMQIARNEYGIAELAIIQKNNDAVNNLLESQNNVVGDITQKGFKRIKTEMELFSEEISAIIDNNLVDAFAGIGEAIGGALANGDNLFDSLGNVLLKSIGKLLNQLGAAAIAVGVGMLAIQASFSNPYAAIAAGVALVAIGTAISSAKTSVDEIGGGASTSSGGGVSRSGFNSSSSPGGFEGRVVFEIAGSKLLGVLNNTSRSNFRTGADNGLITSS